MISMSETDFQFSVKVGSLGFDTIFLINSCSPESMYKVPI